MGENADLNNFKYGHFLQELLVRSKYFYKESYFSEKLFFQQSYFFKIGTFSEQLKFGSCFLFHNINSKQHLLSQESYFFRVATFSKEQLFFTTQLFRSGIFLKLHYLCTSHSCTSHLSVIYWRSSTAATHFVGALSCRSISPQNDIIYIVYFDGWFIWWFIWWNSSILSKLHFENLHFWGITPFLKQLLLRKN